MLRKKFTIWINGKNFGWYSYNYPKSKSQKNSNGIFEFFSIWPVASNENPSFLVDFFLVLTN